jgi:hypothetical protein
MYFKFGFSALFLLSIFLVSQYVFNPLNLYFELPWLDIPMHIIGGFAVSLLLITGLPIIKKQPTLIKVILGTLVVMILWEVYEFYLDVNDMRTWIGWQDTLSDVFNGFLGMFIGYKLFSK